MDSSCQKSKIAETKWLVFKESPIHGLGGFAKTAVPSGSRIIEYLGEKITKQESLRRCEASNHYIFALNEREDLDGNVDWNPARHINHSCAPNCEVEWDGSHLWIVAMRDIKAGEEITFNYGYDLVDYKEYPCACGSAECVGYMVAETFFDKVRANGQNSKSETRNSKQIRISNKKTSS